MTISVLFQRKTRRILDAYWEARFSPPKFTEHFPCEVRVRVYESAGMDTCFTEEDSDDGAFARASDAWLPSPMDALSAHERELYETILKKAKR